MPVLTHRPDDDFDFAMIGRTTENEKARPRHCVSSVRVTGPCTGRLMGVGLRPDRKRQHSETSQSIGTSRSSHCVARFLI